MFNTNLTNEYLVGQKTWGWDRERVEGFIFNAVNATLLPSDQKDAMRLDFQQQLKQMSNI
jgi:hypothetical protein